MKKGQKSYKLALIEANKKNGNLSKAYDLLLVSHNRGFLGATYAIGTWFLFGKHVVLDYKKAVYYLSIAADGKMQEACFDLAVCYEEGKGVKKSLKMASVYYLKSALLGDAEGMVAMGRLYHYGIGVNKDERIADVWFDRAEELGATW